MLGTMVNNAWPLPSRSSRPRSPLCAPCTRQCFIKGSLRRMRGEPLQTHLRTTGRATRLAKKQVLGGGIQMGKKGAGTPHS